MDALARKEELRGNLQAITDRIERAAVGCDRDPAEVCLVVITKFFPARDIELLAELGVSDIGENRAQELRDKARELGALRDHLRVHFVGQVQGNKAAIIADHADVVHAIDRAATAQALAAAAERRKRTLDALVQFSADGDPTRGGVVLSDVNSLCEEVSSCAALRLRGLMVVAPRDVAPDAVFVQAAGLVKEMGARWPAASWLSAGMSGDLEAAVAAGATHVRVGSAIMGQRPPLG